MAYTAPHGIITHVDRIWILGHCKKELNKRAKEIKVIEQFDECVYHLFQNPRHPGLNLEVIDKIKGHQILSSRITRSCRVILVSLTKTEIGLLHFDTDHDGAYNWVHRNRSRIGTMLDKAEEIARGTPLSAYIGTTPALAYDEDSPLALASAAQFAEMVAAGLPRYLAYLDDEQQALANLNVRSLLLVKGGAGTGKTAVAIHRLLKLSRQMVLAETGATDVLYLCYNRILARVAKQMTETLCDGVIPERVELNTFHTWCYEFLQRSGQPFPQPDEYRCRQQVFRAMGTLSAEQKGALNGRDGIFVDEEIEQVIKHNGIHTREEYLAFERRGLGKENSLKAAAREVIWDIFERAEGYQRELNICRYCDFPLLVLRLLSTMQEPPRYRAVIIDEGQDCSPVLIRLARRLLDSTVGQLTVFADPAQAIYKCGFQWTQSELKPSGGNVRWLRRTYRTTRQIYDLAGCLLDESDELQEEFAQMLPPERFGTRPLFLIEANKQNLLDLLIDRIAQVAAEKPANQIGIIAAKWDTLKDIEQRLVQRGIPTAPAERGTMRLNEVSVKLLSMHSVKGLDFPHVFLVGPRAYDLGGATHNLLPETRRLFYVALTRASENLTVGVLAGKHHPLLEKLDDALYEAQGSQAHSFINGRGVSIDSQGIVSVHH